MQLAHVHVARLRVEPGSPEHREPVRGLAVVARLAERAPRVVWQHPVCGADSAAASSSATTALCSVPSGKPPTPVEAVERLRYLQRDGSTARAFTLRRRFDRSGSPVAVPPARSLRPR